MPNENDKLGAYKVPVGVSKTGTGIKIGLPGLHARVKAAEQTQKKDATQAGIEAATMPNRIGLMLDCSGSMSGEKIALLQKAYDGFTTACDMSTTALAVACFPGGDAESGDSNFRGNHGSQIKDLPLTNNQSIIMLHGMGFKADGGTPMMQAMERMIKQPITRGIIISDGQANDPDGALGCAEEKYSPSETPIDCVHVGASHAGEELLKRIAKATGGIYIKFTDVAAFAKAFDFLTPARRSLLLSGAVNALGMGATEIKL